MSNRSEAQEVADYWRDLHARTQSWSLRWKKAAKARQSAFPNFEAMRKSRDFYRTERDAALARCAALEEDLKKERMIYVNGSIRGCGREIDALQARIDAYECLQKSTEKVVEEKTARVKELEAGDERHWRKERIDLINERNDMGRRIAELEAALDSFYEAIAHGDEEHRRWLREKVDSYLGARAALGEKKEPP